MKKTAVLVYNTFCGFELSVALETLALAQREIAVFGATRAPVRSEEGLTVVPDSAISEVDIFAYDSLLLPGAMDIREAIENPEILAFIARFRDKAIGAISIAPLLLVKVGFLVGKPFMAGVNKDEIMEEGFSEEELSGMVGWDEHLARPVADGCIISDRIVTSTSDGFVKFGLAFGRMLGIDTYPKAFGLS